MNIPSDFLSSLPQFFISSVEGDDFKTPGIIKIPLDDYTEIFGENGAGKTTVLDMIAFALTGKDSMGNKIEFINEGRGMARVTLNLKNDSGIGYEVCRTITRSAKGTLSNTITLNLEKIKAKEFNEIFNEELVLSILNPVYFFNLTPAKARVLLAKLMNVNVQDVLTENMSKLASNSTEVDQIMKLIGPVSKIDDVLSMESSIKDTIKVLQKETDDLSYRLDVLKMSADEEKTKIDGIKEELLLMSIDDKTRAIFKSILDSTFKEEVRLSEIKILNDEYREKKVNLDIQNRDLKYIKDFYKKYLISIEDKVNKILPNTEINLITSKIEVNKITNEEEMVDKEIFDIYYNGRSLKNCSMAETIKCGIEIADILVLKSGICLPTFIDNAESITSFPMPLYLNQLVSLTVRKNTPLSIGFGDKMVDVKTKASMPMPSEEDEPERRVFADFF